MVGDTRFDAIAACRAGVACLGVRSGGKKSEELLGGGARGVWRDCADLLGHLDEALRVASPAPGRLTADLLDQLMRSALEQAREGLRAGEAPIGCVISDGDRRILARAHQQVGVSADPTAHAELRALRQLARRNPEGVDALVLVTTLEPCVMCLGAAIVAGVDTVVYALGAPVGTGSQRVAPSCTGHHQVPRIVGGVLAGDSRTLLSEWLLTGRDDYRTACVQHLVATA
jgi:tRNA(adenine34) deaminase